MSGPIPGRCGARTRSDGFCGQLPMKAQRRCYIHGGKSPQAQAAALTRLERRRAEQALRVEVGKMGGRIDVESAEAMRELVAAAYANVLVLEEAIAALDPGPGLISARMTLAEALGGEREPRPPEGVYGPSGAHGDGAPHILWQMYGEERDRLLRAAKACLDAGVEARLVEIEESKAMAQVAEFREIFLAALAAVELTPAQREALGQAIAGEIRRRRPGALAA